MIADEIEYKEEETTILPTIEEADTMIANETEAMVDDFRALGVVMDKDSSSEFSPKDQVLVTNEDIKGDRSLEPSDVLMDEAIDVVLDEDAASENRTASSC